MATVDISGYQQKKVKKETKQQAVKGSFSWTELLSKDISFGSGKLSDKKKDSFFFELSTLLQSGIDLKNSLDLMTLESVKEKHVGIIKEIKDKVIAGQSMALAVQSSGKFSDYDFFSIQIGEETGNLAEVMKDLAVFYRRKIAQQRKIVGALTYPLIVLSTSAGAVFFMLRFVVPMFSDVFKRFGGKLPWITQVVISFSHFVEQFFIPGFLLLAGLVYLIYRNRNRTAFRKFTSELILKIPVLGELVKKIYLARFCNTMRLLVSTRIPLLRAIAMSGQTIVFYPLEVSLKKVEQGIMEGRALHECLRDFSIYPPKLVQLIKVGEEINKLDYFFESIAGQYVDEIEHQTNTLSKLIEPLIIIFLGLVVGFILVAMYLPMFEMSNSF
ncbi:type II secretion system F family protein [Pedobacter africanus]|uniref:General secretion pathway protein F n=1 Tax=Pedobacter africanus TaxID=151894 RepID=A0A1W2EGK6_9SPHI|nr:type II secretion system F family protein [Pedobacter africanus]SMD08476.1 type II secretion system protein F (GspF) [Pedobacter africanus]